MSAFVSLPKTSDVGSVDAQLLNQLLKPTGRHRTALGLVDASGPGEAPVKPTLASERPVKPTLASQVAAPSLPTSKANAVTLQAAGAALGKSWRQYQPRRFVFAHNPARGCCEAAA